MGTKWNINTDGESTLPIKVNKLQQQTAQDSINLDTRELVANNGTTVNFDWNTPGSLDCKNATLTNVQAISPPIIMPPMWEFISTATHTLENNKNYVAESAGFLTFTLPAVQVAGYEIKILANNLQGFRVNPNNIEQVSFGPFISTTIIGYIETLSTGNFIHLVCLQPYVQWAIISSVGTIDVV